MRRNFKPDPERAMLAFFDHSEAERMVPRWRRAATRLWLTMILFAGLVLWACAVLKEAH